MMNASMFTNACEQGECIYARTNTAEYWMVISSRGMAEVYRKGNSEKVAQFLGRRRLGAQIIEHDGFTMYDEKDQPIAAIVPTDIRKVSSMDIPLKGE